MTVCILSLASHLFLLIFISLDPLATERTTEVRIGEIQHR